MIHHCYWHLVVKNGNFTLSTDILWSSMAIAHCYWHLVVKNGNCTLLMTSSGEEWQWGHSSFHVQTALLSFMNQLQIRSVYFERYCRNWLSFTELNEHFLTYLFRSPRYRQWNLQSCHHCVQHPWKLTSMDFWSSRNERKPLSKKQCVLRECFGVSQKWWMLELSNLCYCVQHPWKLTGRHFLRSRNERKPHFKQKCVLRKCCGVSQKWWMLELSNLCHCVQHPWNFTSRDFWSSRNKRKSMDPLGYTKFGRQTFFWWWNIATDVYWSRIAISHCCSHLVIMNGCFTLLLASSVQEWQIDSYLPVQRSFVCRSSPGGHSSFHVQTVLFSFVNQLQLRSVYFETYCRNWLSFTELNEHFLIYLFKSPRYRQWNLQSCHHCNQHPWKLTSRDFWSSRNER